MSRPVVMTVVGARPQFVKAAVVSRALAKTSIAEVIVHTGQHYDPGMSDVFFEELGIPRPAHALGVGGGSHGQQTGEMLRKIEEILSATKPDGVLVFGDTNSTLAAALAASKLHIPIAHVEAGLRSFNRRMPEEINRVLTDHLSDLLFCPTRSAIDNLSNEGIRNGVILSGDVMYDMALAMAPVADQTSSLREDVSFRSPYVLATIHRAENTDDPDLLRSIFEALGAVSHEIPVVLPVHPRTRKALAEARVELARDIRVVDPLGFVDMTFALRHASVVVTDSGGVQKEAYFHGVPCITVRTETEWTETVSSGWNRLAPPGDSDAIRDCIRRTLSEEKPRTTIADYGDGHASEKIARAIETLLR